MPTLPSPRCELSLSRRTFLAATAAAGALAIFPRLAESAADIAPDVKITGVQVFTAEFRRPKFVGSNSYGGVKGYDFHDRVIRLTTNAGIEGIGRCRADAAECKKLPGMSVQELLKSSAKIEGPLGTSTMALWDIVGKAEKKPVWKLLGDQGAERVPVYDGTIYFTDLLPQFKNTWQDEFRREIDAGMAAGHRFFKVKIGRGRKFLPRSKGDDRDVEVMQLLVKHGGPGVGWACDANDGYKLDGAKRFVERTADLNIAFVEELFQGTPEEQAGFKKFIRSKTRNTLLADGENSKDLNDLRPYIAVDAFDLLQADMNVFGVEQILAESKLAGTKARIAPDNWGSFLGFIAQVQVGRAIPNFYRGEEDAGTSDVISAPGYHIKDGAVSLPDVPGFGVVLNHDALKKLKLEVDVKA